MLKTITLPSRSSQPTTVQYLILSFLFASCRLLYMCMPHMISKHVQIISFSDLVFHFFVILLETFEVVSHQRDSRYEILYHFRYIHICVLTCALFSLGFGVSIIGFGHHSVRKRKFQIFIFLFSFWRFVIFCFAFGVGTNGFGLHLLFLPIFKDKLLTWHQIVYPINLSRILTDCFVSGFVKWAWAELNNTVHSVYICPAVCSPLYNYLAPAWPL